MAEKTGIQWADATWNPWVGCKKVSAGCKNCYMFRDMTFYGKDPNFIDATSDKTFRNPLTWAKNKKLKNGARIFTCSWSDWFIKEADSWRPLAWDIIKATPQFTYMILTKRPELIKDRLPKDWNDGYKNVWLLVSAEDQKTYEERWNLLTQIKTRVRGLSLEPLLGPIVFPELGVLPEWIIVGGESGQSNRVMDIAWAKSIRDYAIVNEIPFFFKQIGGRKKIEGGWGGRLLDGRLWEEFPELKT